MVFVAALVSLAIAIVLTVLPGPAFVFYALAGGLIAGESAWVARVLDRWEVVARRIIARIRKRMKRASSSAG